MAYQPPPPGPGELDMDEIARLIRSADIPAFVAHTGGGVAVVYAGRTLPDANGDPRWTACGGPGHFLPDPETGAVFAHARAVVDDFHISPETEDGLAVSATDIGLTTEEQAAAVLVAQTLRQRLLTLAEAREARDSASGPTYDRHGE